MTSSSAISSSLLPLFLITAALAVPASTSQSTLPVSVFNPKGEAVAERGGAEAIPNKPKDGMATGQPADLEEASRMVAEEKEEELLDQVEGGLTIPAGGPRPALIIVMGPASCGKSTIGLSLSAQLGIPFIDGDSLHPRSNVDKMSAGIPLDDNDREPWLALIRSTADRVCREQWVTGELAVRSSGEGAALEDMANFEFGEGDKWAQSLTEDAGLKDLGLGVRGKLGRPAVIIACSALKKKYRDMLRGKIDTEPPEKSDLPHSTRGIDAVHMPASSRLETYFVYCKGMRELLWDRISKRQGHFMGAKMLDSQLATLEDPSDEEGVCCVDISLEPDEETKEAVEGVLRISGMHQKRL